MIIPAGVTSVTFDAYGAQGGSAGTNGGVGGLGAEAKVTMAVTPGQQYNIYVGGAGAEASKADGHGSPSVSGGWNGGGKGGGSNGTVTTSGGGGGGATDVRSGTNLDTRVLVAAGGGGGGGWGGGYSVYGVMVGGTGGQGGGQGAGEGYGTGPDSGPTRRFLCDPIGGSGGTANAGGGAGRSGDTSATCFGGAGGGLNSGGHYDYAAHDRSWDGSLGRGGDGGCLQFPDCNTSLTTSGGGGGGGGGGVYGGAGDEAVGGFANSGGSSGGGGGSSTGPSGSTFRRGFNPGDGKLFVTYATNVTVRSSVSPNLYTDNPSYTATVSPASATGNMEFQANGNDLRGCISRPVDNGAATCALAPGVSMSVGSQTIKALFHGRDGFADNSATLNQLTLAQTDMKLSTTDDSGAAVTSVASGQPLTITASMHATGAPVQNPWGGVQFYDNGSLLETVWPQQVTNATSKATLTKGLTEGQHRITAIYLGTVLTAGASADAVDISATSPLPNGNYRLKSDVSGKALEVLDASQTNGAAVDQRTYSGASNQQWTVSKQNDGSYTLLAKHSNKALDVTAGSPDDGAAIIQWTAAASANQRWWIVPGPVASYHLLSVNSGKALDVAAGSTADGGAVVQWTYSGSTNQSWKFSRTEPVVTIDPTPKASTITAGGSQTYTVKGWDYGHDYLGDVTDSTTFRIFPDGSCTGNVCTATKPGYHAVDAQAGGAIYRIDLTVNPR